LKSRQSRQNKIPKLQVSESGRVGPAVPEEVSAEPTK